MAQQNKMIVMLFYALYLYVLIRIILFKYASPDISFLMSQLHDNLENPGLMQARMQYANFTPFVSINRNLDRLSNPTDMVNLLGNIALFIPGGAFVVWLTQKPFLKVILSSLGISLALECSQVLFSMGRFDVDDLILNGLGGMLGYLIFRPLKKKPAGKAKR